MSASTTSAPRPSSDRSLQRRRRGASGQGPARPAAASAGRARASASARARPTPRARGTAQGRLKCARDLETSAGFLVGDVGCADVADDQADLRIGGGADPARRVLHRHAPAGRLRARVLDGSWTAPADPARRGAPPATHRAGGKPPPPPTYEAARRYTSGAWRAGSRGWGGRGGGRGGAAEAGRQRRAGSRVRAAGRWERAGSAGKHDPPDRALGRRGEASSAGLKRGGSKSDSPEWMFASSDGKCARKPHASTQIGTRGLPEVVAITKGTLACGEAEARGFS